MGLVGQGKRRHERLATQATPSTTQQCLDISLPEFPEPQDIQRQLPNPPPLLQALGGKHYPQLKRLLDQGENPNACVLGTSLLAFSVNRGDPEEIRILLDGGADPNRPLDRIGDSPLFAALIAGQFDIARLLLSRGADPLHRGSAGDTALHRLAMAPVTDEPGFPKKQEELAEELIRRGVDVNVRLDTKGSTALMYAVAQKNTRLIACLLQHGADVDLQNRRGETALSLARKWKLPDLVRVLEEPVARKAEQPGP